MYQGDERCQQELDIEIQMQLRWLQRHSCPSRLWDSSVSQQAAPSTCLQQDPDSKGSVQDYYLRRSDFLVKTLTRTGRPAGEIDPDEAIVAADSLSQQALEAQAEDLAIEDTLYALERALTNGVITADAYLKQVRG